ncbi:bacillithiol biosynthesis deacetylase BshB1 [Membranihabitans marinus]|uniref:bacillithiol biosynthesis deacetylase BshB1 n=1 Tax=Membranihabitans marinus TaxID=1227546 RepID=UPI001F00ABF9|nr:bacillithiol biosynthesis deacetylase BshB1 [Membranihabitans marinus]
MMSKVDILAIGVHPDDIELGAGGTVASQIAQGYKVGLLDLTRGELGTRGTPELRIEESLRANKILGGEFRLNIGLADGFFTGSVEEKLKIVEVIRWCQPKIILTNAVRDRHPDHGRAAELVNQAAFLAGLKSIETQYEGKVQERWRPDVIYHYIQDYILEPDIVFDISDYFMVKMEAIKAFRSQFFDPNNEELDSPLTNPDYFDQLEGRARSLGRQIGVTYGEGFTVRRYVGTDNLFQLI